MISVLIEFLSAYYQQGNVTGIIGIARNILNVIPDDIVALQFMALALLQIGQKEAAITLFHRVTGILNRNSLETKTSVCELALITSYREATRPNSGLGEGWHRLGIVLDEFGFHRLAERAKGASRQALATNLNSPAVDIKGTIYEQHENI